MEISTPHFKQNAIEAMKDEQLQGAMSHVRKNFIEKRTQAANGINHFETMRDNARDIKNHVLENLDIYLEHFEEKVMAQGGHVHWAATASDARNHVLDICRKHNAQTVTKGKSMISEEIGLNDFLEAQKITPVETDLGEYIIQLRGESPSHIIAPAVHVSIDQVRDDFRREHTHLDKDRPMDDPQTLLSEARDILRQKFLNADIGITGANFLVAETGTSVIVTNEGNGDLTQTLPRVHIVLASIEKIVPNLEDMSQILRVLARSATGQEASVYTTLSSGPKREGDVDGPEEYHVILLDNGRSSMLGTEFQEMLRCIRCGACMNHCPVYHALGGHAYGWVYPGPMGSVLSPGLTSIDETGHMPNASTFCGRCESVCPVRIPLPKLMRNWREKEFEKHLTPASQRRNLKLWAWLAKRPALYRNATGLARLGMRLIGAGSGHVRWLPMGGEWTKHRQMPKPEAKSFMAQYQARNGRTL